MPMDLADLRADVPALEDVVYMNTGAASPSPRRVVEAANDCLAHHEYESPAKEGMYEAAFGVYDDTREAVAGLLGTESGNVALTQSTTDGINRIACALDWDDGDTVVRTDLEHSAGILPWRRLRERVDLGVAVLETDRGRLRMDRLKERVEGARLLCLSSLTWNYGTRLPVSEVVDVAHDADCRVLVDAVQSVGQRPVDVEAWGADFVAAAGHKWLLGPWGAGFLYVRPGLAEAIRPGLVGYRSVADPNATGIDFKPGAHRFEVGTTSPAPYAGLRAAIELRREVGPDAIEARIRSLTERFKAGLDDDRLLSPREFESGLVTFRADDPEGLVERLQDEGIRIRSLPYPAAARASLHAFNTAEEVDRLLAALES